MKFILPVLLAFLCQRAHALNIVIDPGHDVAPVDKRGSLGTCGRAEVDYNDAIAKQVIAEFQKDDRYKAFLTRDEGKQVADKIRGLGIKNAASFLHTEGARASYGRPGSTNLLGRALLANYHKCDAFISIHHDSVATDRLECDATLCADEANKKFATEILGQRKHAIGKRETPHHPCGRTATVKGGAKLADSFKKDGLRTGYVILVSYEDDPDSVFEKSRVKRKAESVKLASAVGRNFQSKGGKIGGLERPVSNHHVFKRKNGTDEDCPSCSNVSGAGVDTTELEKLGILDIRNAAMRESRCPAILIEVGNTADPEDEAKITNPDFQAEFVQMVKAGVDEYFMSVGKLAKADALKDEPRAPAASEPKK